MVYRQIIAVLVTLLTTSLAIARTGDVKGKVTDMSNQPLEGVNVVVLTDSNKKLAKAELTDAQGSFTIAGIADGIYVVKATLLGYEPYSTGQVVVSGGEVVLPVMVMQQKSGSLKEVTVQALKPLIEVRADKIVVNVENSIVNAGASAMEVLSRSPGVHVDQNDNISLKGRSGVMIWIDGKQTPMSGADLANILKAMPASALDKIELISNPGAKYDAEGVAGIINIKTKKDQRLGMNGSANTSYAQGVYPKYGGGLNLNYRNKKLNVNGSYNYSDRTGFNHLVLYRQFYNGNERLYAYDQNNFTVFPIKIHSGSAGIDYTLSKKTTAGVSLSGSYGGFVSRSDNYTNTEGAESSARLYDFQTKGSNDNRWYNYAVNGFVRHTFDSTGKELSVDVDYAAYTNRANQNFTTIYADFDNNTANNIPDYIQETDLKGLTQIRAVKADYSHPMPKNARLEAGLKTTYVTADSDPKYYDKSSGTRVLDMGRTNHFIYYENINAAYTNYSKEWMKWGMQLGLRMEHTNARGDQLTLNRTFDTSYVQLYPSLAFTYHLPKEHDLNLTLSRRIERPNYDQLNPFKFFIDKTTYREGYPYLYPASSYSAELSHIFKQRFITTFTYSYALNHITEVIQPSDVEDSVTVQTHKNIKHMTFVGLGGSYNTQVTKWWTNVSNINIFHAQYVGNIANTPLNNGSFALQLNTVNSFILGKDFTSELSFNYQGKQVYGYMDVNPVWMLNAGVQKNFFNRTLTVRLNVQDIFWRGYPSATSTYNNYKEDFIAERDTRQVSIAVTYRFGKKTVAPVRRRSGGAEDEKGRVGSTGA
ncbi:MAG: outer membrane beta-barrel protein [Flavipsychrobacter sp.]|nr:outer membrane beta-barrel protein [Flavipsychrobacter sp.]